MIQFQYRFYGYSKEVPPDISSEDQEWRLYFCIIGELWQAVRDKQPEDLVVSYLDELKALAFTTSQDLLYRRCHHILRLAQTIGHQGTAS